MSPARTATGRRPDIEAELKDKYNVEYEFLRKVDPDEFDLDKSLENQARFEALDEATVQLYTEGVVRGDNFPAVIAQRQGRAANPKLVIIDGNHRLAAHVRAGAPIDVYEIDRSTKPQVVAAMTFSFNTRHGRPTSVAERVEHAMYLINNGASQEAAAAEVNVAMKDLRKALMKANADKRAQEVGVDMREWDALSQVAKGRLLNVSTDEGFHGAVHLTYAAKLTSDEVFELVTLLNTSKSANKQRQIIRAETERYADRAQAMAGGVLGTAERRAMSPKARVSMVLGQVLALPDDVTLLVKAYAEPEKEEAAGRIMDAAMRLEKLALTLDPSQK